MSSLVEKDQEFISNIWISSQISVNMLINGYIKSGTILSVPAVLIKLILNYYDDIYRWQQTVNPTLGRYGLQPIKFDLFGNYGYCDIEGISVSLYVNRPNIYDIIKHNITPSFPLQTQNNTIVRSKYTLSVEYEISSGDFRLASEDIWEYDLYPKQQIMKLGHQMNDVEFKDKIFKFAIRFKYIKKCANDGMITVNVLTKKKCVEEKKKN